MNLKAWPGYSVAFIIESFGGLAASISPMPYLTILIGSCWILASITEDITNDLFQLNMSTLSERNQHEIHVKFCKISKRLSDAKQLSEFNQFYSIKIEMHINC